MKYAGSYTRDSFLQEVTNESAVRNSLVTIFPQNYTLNRFFRILPADYDSEDNAMIQYVIDYEMPRNHTAGDSYAGTVKRGSSSNSWNGWMLYLRSNGGTSWSSVLYFYSVTW
jgi:hypothetical protein